MKMIISKHLSRLKKGNYHYGDRLVLQLEDEKNEFEDDQIKIR